MTRKESIIGVLLFIGLVMLIILQFYTAREVKVVTNEDLEKSIELLTNKIDSISKIRDSLIIVTDTNRVKIITLEKRYETIRDSIISQSVDSDCVTFAKYISKYNSRLSNSDNTLSAQDN